MEKIIWKINPPNLLLIIMVYVVENILAYENSVLGKNVQEMVNDP